MCQWGNFYKTNGAEGKRISLILEKLRKPPHGFQSFIQTLFGSSLLQEEKLDMCGHLNGASTQSYPCRHLHIQRNLQRAQTCTVVRSSWSEGHSCLATSLCSFSFLFFLCILIWGGFPMRFSFFHRLFQPIFCIWVPNMAS